MRGLRLLAVLAGCADPAPPPLASADGVEVTSRLMGGDKGQQLVVVVVAPDDASLSELTTPMPPGVTLGDPEVRVERLGDRVATTRRYPFRAPSGSHIVEGLCVTDSTGTDVCAEALYVDIGRDADRAELVDIAEPEALWPLPSAQLVAAVLGGAFMLGLGIYMGFRPREEVEVGEVASEAPHVEALRRWEAIRSDDALSDHDKAAALSEVFRAYAERALGFPARAYTTTETLAHLDSLANLKRENLPRAKRLLRATDRVKYAEANPNADFFADLDSDLRAFVEATRPRHVEEA